MRNGGSAAEIIDDEVRELIRRRGVDPFLDAGRIRSLVREVVLDYEDRAASSSLPPVGDHDQAVRASSMRLPGSARCSAISMIPRSRRSGSTNPETHKCRQG